jgi:hypothetical protein
VRVARVGVHVQCSQCLLQAKLNSDTTVVVLPLAIPYFWKWRCAFSLHAVVGTAGCGFCLTVRCGGAPKRVDLQTVH